MLQAESDTAAGKADRPDRNDGDHRAEYTPPYMKQIMINNATSSKLVPNPAESFSGDVNFGPS